MSTLTVIIRCTVGCALGSSLGLAMIVAGRFEQGIGLAIIGGFLGIVLAVASVLYRTTATETLSRGLLLFLRLTAAKNIPGGDKLVPVEDKETQGKYGQNADPAALDNRMYWGMKIGAALSVIPAILISIYIRDTSREPAPLVLEVMKRIVIGFAFVAFVGGGCGAACGALTVFGVHRRNIVLGTITGLIIGAGLATAIVPGARVPGWQVYLFGCGVFGWLGMVCGLFSGDNFRSPARDTGEDTDDISDS